MRIGYLTSLVAALAVVTVASCARTDLTPNVQCAAGEVLCGDACATVTHDHAHCGACGVACAPAQVCWQGACASDCGGGQTRCGDACFDTQTDSTQCGACGASCGKGLACVHGRCSTTCEPGQALCARGDHDYCVSPSTDNANCGACGVVCGPEEVCSQGVCASTCAGNQSLCTPKGDRAYCAATGSDGFNCGDCGVACGPNKGCVGGVCTAICSADQTACPVLHPSRCANLQSDTNDCGQCDAACGNAAVCAAGHCACVGDQKWCGASAGCVDLLNDSANCGYCGRTCAGTCSFGHCALAIATKVYPDGLTADESYLYYSTGSEIRRIPSGGGQSTSLTQPGYQGVTGFTSLQNDANNVYFLDALQLKPGRICKQPKAGGVITVLAEFNDSLNGLAIDGTNAYSQGENYIYSVPLAGGATTALAPNHTYASRDRSIASNGTDLYFYDGAFGLLSVPVGGGPTTVRVSNVSFAALFSDGFGNIYSEQGGLVRLQAYGNTFQWIGPTGALTGIFGETIYLLNYPTLIAVDLTTWKSSNVVEDASLLAAGPLAANSSYVFWAPYQGGIMQVTH